METEKHVLFDVFAEPWVWPSATSRRLHTAALPRQLHEPRDTHQIQAESGLGIHSQTCTSLHAGNNQLLQPENSIILLLSLLLS